MKKLVIRLVVLLALLSTLNVATVANGEERTFNIQTIIDPGMPGLDTVCADAPFVPSAHFGAQAWTYKTRKSDGMIVEDPIRKIGIVRDCIQITDSGFSPFSIHPFYIRFDLGDEIYAGTGQCTIISNNVPVMALILASCTASLIDTTTGEAVGNAVSNTTYNPFGLPGYDTGAYWTLRLYSDKPITSEHYSLEGDSAETTTTVAEHAGNQ